MEPVYLASGSRSATAQVSQAATSRGRVNTA